ncbi:MAG TPA: hypothetical protein VGB77_22315 [Abditibacteriaceae bacterium]|jgi:outer membrane murein-binding lipoprotein Lpp
MPATLTLLHVVLLLFAAVMASSVLAALITARYTQATKNSEQIRAIETEVRASLRADLDANEADIKAVRLENDDLKRRVDRITDNLVRFTRNVLRMNRLVRQFLPHGYQILADDIDAEGKRLVKLLGAELETGDDPMPPILQEPMPDLVHDAVRARSP